MTIASFQTALDELAQGIGRLIDLAQEGEIDPWEVQVIEVIDRYLAEVDRFTAMTSGCDVELFQFGQAFLSASLLVLLKAETLAALEDPDALLTSPEMDLAQIEDAQGNSRLPTHLERHLRRRATARPPQSRRVTLQELVTQLQAIASTIAEKPPKPVLRRAKPYSQAQASRAIAELAHQENLTEMASQLETFLSQGLTWEESQPWMELEHLVHHWQQSQTPEPVNNHANHDLSARVGIFWALLLLASQSKVELAQEDFYQPIKIKPIS